MNHKEIKESVKNLMISEEYIRQWKNFDKEDEMFADWLYYRCKKYIEKYQARGK